MAGDWIKMRMDLIDDPAVAGIAIKLDLDEYSVVGRLHKLWSWADKHTTTGVVTITARWIDKHLECSGFAEAMVSVGWLIMDAANGTVAFPNFDRHNGASSKTRCDAAARKRVSRVKQSPEIATNVSKSSQHLVTNVTEVCDGVTEFCDQNVTVEKRREEKSIQTNKQESENEKVFNPFKDNPEFCEVANQYIKTRTAKHGPAAQTTVEAWYYDLARFPVADAIEIMRFSTAAEAKRPITNGDHARARASPGVAPGFSRRAVNVPRTSNSDLLSKIK